MPSFKTIKAYFNFTTSERRGIFLLLSLIICLQAFYYFADFSATEEISKEKQQWLLLQTKFDTLNNIKNDYSPKIYPFNPNFITDFKGYKLGMSMAQIDRLLAFRKTNQYVNSAQEFQSVTKISDSLLNVIAPFFKFPDWVKNKKGFKNFEEKAFINKQKVIVLDINQATQEDLKKVYGIGDGLSERILKEKNKFGSFVSMQQINDIWGLSPEVIEKLNQSFKVLEPPLLNKINVNNASIKELGLFPYFRYPISKNIVTYRSMNGEIKNSADLIKIKDFPIDKVDIIILYLDF